MSTSTRDGHGGPGNTTHPAGPPGWDGLGHPSRTFGMMLICAVSPPVAGQVTGSAESDTNRVRNKLRKFLQRRPTLQSLRERGYIKGGCRGVLGWGWIKDTCWDESKSRLGAEMGCQSLSRVGAGTGLSLRMSPGWRAGGDRQGWS